MCTSKNEKTLLAELELKICKCDKPQEVACVLTSARYKLTETQK